MRPSLQVKTKVNLGADAERRLAEEQVRIGNLERLIAHAAARGERALLDEAQRTLDMMRASLAALRARRD